METIMRFRLSRGLRSVALATVIAGGILAFGGAVAHADDGSSSGEGDRRATSDQGTVSDVLGAVTNQTEKLGVPVKGLLGQDDSKREARESKADRQAEAEKDKPSSSDKKAKANASHSTKSTKGTAEQDSTKRQVGTTVKAKKPT